MKKKTGNKIKKTINKIKSNPKEFINSKIDRLKNYIKNNIVFCAFIVLMVINELMLRIFTINTWESALNLGPIFLDTSLLLFLASIVYLRKPKHRFPTLFGVCVVCTAICVINSIYYTYYSSFSSISLLSTARFISDVGDAVVDQVLEFTDFIYILAPIILLALYLYIKPKRDEFSFRDTLQSSRQKVLIGFKAAFVFLLLFLCTLTPTKVGRFISLWNREYVVMNFGAYVYHIDDLVDSLSPKLSNLFGYDTAVREFTEFYDGRKDKQTYSNEFTNKFEGYNVIAIHGESIQNFVIGLTINGKEVTPNLNKIVKESIYFDNFYSQVSVGTSSDAEFTSLTSLLPVKNGTVFVSYYDREYVSTPSLLKDKGYYNYVMHANKASFWNRDVMYNALGYERFYSKDDFVVDSSVGLGLSDMDFFKQAIAKLKVIDKENSPYYGTFITLSNHTPFVESAALVDFDVTINEKVPTRTGYTEVKHQYLDGTKLGAYLQSVHYSDMALGYFMEELEKEGLLDKTLFVLYGDHDARLDIADYELMYNYDIKTDSVLPKDDPNYVEFDDYQYELNRKVPFLIWSKETKESLHTTISDVMGMYDIAPTLGNMLGFYNKYAIGHDIFEIGSDNVVVFANSNFVTNKVYYNAQKNEYLSLDGKPIDVSYIEKNEEYANKCLDTSNSLIVFDLIKKQNEGMSSEKDIKTNIKSK